MGEADLVLPVREADGEGDHAKHGGGAAPREGPSTAFQAGPLPIGCADRED